MFVPLAFLKRDFSRDLSYRLSFFMQFGGIFFNIAIFFFMSQLFGSAVSPQLEAYGGDYFSFVLIGLAFTGFMGLSLSNFASSIREGQVMGTLEMMLLSPTRLSVILLSSSIWAYAQTLFRVIIYLIMGSLIFGADLSNSNFGAATLVLVLSILSFSGIGILSAAVVLLVKKGDPVAWILGSASSLLAGVYYPITVLPDWLEPVSKILPLTYALDAIRLAMLQGAPLSELWDSILVLLGFVVVLTPLSFMAFRVALGRAKKDGSLIQY